MNKLLLIIGFSWMLIIIKYVDSINYFIYIVSFNWLFWSSLLEELDRLFNNRK